MTAVAATLHRYGIRPKLRNRELVLLGLAGGTLFVGWLSLASQQAGQLTLGQPGILIIYLALLAAIHVAFVMTGRRMDQVLLPVTALLGGLSLLLMSRLPQDLVVQDLLGLNLDLAPLQLFWLSAALIVLAALAILVRNDNWLRQYKYTWAALGIGLLLLVFVLGDETNGARLTVRIGPFAGQPSELLKVILVVFLAGYLAENRLLLARASTRVGRIAVPPLPYLLPMLAMWASRWPSSSCSATWAPRSCSSASS